MTLLLTHEDVCAVVDMADAIAAMEEAFREEGEGAALLPPRINMKAGKGWLRVGPVALERSGWMGFKAMNLAPGRGVRYQVHLYASRRASCSRSWMRSTSRRCAPARRARWRHAGSRRQRKMQIGAARLGCRGAGTARGDDVAGFVALGQDLQSDAGEPRAARRGVPRPARARCASTCRQRGRRGEGRRARRGGRQVDRDPCCTGAGSSRA